MARAIYENKTIYHRMKQMIRKVYERKNNVLPVVEEVVEEPEQDVEE